MTCLQRYWLKEFTKFFVIIQVVILVLFVFIDYLSRLERFLNSEITLLGALWYVALKIPYMFVQLTPAGILLSVVTVFSLMAKSNEMIALRSCGISAYYFVKPVIFVGMALSLFTFFIGETLIPVTMSKSNDIKYNVIKKQKGVSVNRKDIWIQNGRDMIHFQYFDPAARSVAGVTLIRTGENFQPVSRLDAKTGFYENGGWVLEEIILQTYNKAEQDFEVELKDRLFVALEVTPEDLGEIVKQTDQMSFAELKAYVRKVEQEGYDPTAFRVDMHAKIAFPLICIIMALTGAATGIKPVVKDNIPAAVALGVLISFAYWVFLGVSLSLGYGKILPPPASAWAPNLLFCCLVGIYLAYAE